MARKMISPLSPNDIPSLFVILHALNKGLNIYAGLSEVINLSPTRSLSIMSILYLRSKQEVSELE
jgi:hypothetical protein